MTDQFMSEPVIREKYGLQENDTFEGSFSSVSIESILFGIFASAAYVMEQLFDNFTASVDRKIAAAIPATIPWYHNACLKYQHGDKLVLDQDTQQYRYEEEDPSKQLVKFAACRDKGGYVYILVSGEDEEGLPTALKSNVIMPFEEYLKAIKPAGIQLDIHTYNPDDVVMSIAIQYDSLILNPDGSLINDESRYPVEDAINTYLRNIEYGGIFNKTKLVDAIQQADGVLDLQVQSIAAKAYGDDSYTVVVKNNYESVGGAFKANNLRNTISYAKTL